jgi:hypothetical protein
MPLYTITETDIVPVPEAEFAALKIKEGALQRLLRTNIGVIALEILVIAEEFWRTPGHAGLFGSKQSGAPGVPAHRFPGQSP